MTLVSVLGYLRQHAANLAKSIVLIATLLLLNTGCSSSPKTVSSSSVSQPSPSRLATRPKIKPVDPPALINELAPWLDSNVPQVQIRQPKADQVVESTTVDVRLDVQDLPIYKDETWLMAPHLELFLDNQFYSSVYDLEQPVILEQLSPGTHTLRVFAARPWHESFKNVGAYDQITFHVFAQTDENTPAAQQPLLTYGSPIGRYGAEPILLDFYLTDAPLHQVAQDNPAIADWRVRYTINGDSLTLKTWQPTYITGLRPGQNWVQLTLVDDEDNPIEGVFNNTVRLIDYDSTLDDTLAKIVRGELTLEEVGRIIDPTYEPPVVEPPVMETPAIPETSEDEAFDIPEAVPADEPEVVESERPQPEIEQPQNADPAEPEAAAEVIKAPDSGLAPGTEQPMSEPEKVELEEPEKAELEETKKVELEEPEKAELEETESLETETSKTSTEPDSLTLEETVEETTAETPSAETVPAAETADEPEVLEDSTEAAAKSAPAVEPSEDATDSEANPSGRRYFQRLYEYRDRSMKTYER